MEDVDTGLLRATNVYIPILSFIVVKTVVEVYQGINKPSIIYLPILEFFILVFMVD